MIIVIYADKKLALNLNFLSDSVLYTYIMIKLRSNLATITLAYGLFSPFANGIVFDISASMYNDGMLTQSFDIDPSNPGDDIQISFSSDTDAFQVFGGVQMPSLSDALSDDWNGNDKALALIVNFSIDPAELIRVQIDFLYAGGVTDVRIPIFDVDAGTVNVDGKLTLADEIDQVSYLSGSSNVELDLSGAALDTVYQAYNSGRNSIYGLGESTNTSSLGNLLIDFGNIVTSSVFFDYRNFASTTQPNPALQGIAIGDIEYTVVPEPTAFALLVGIVATGAVFSSRSRVVRRGS
jgi:hypothetical protein